MTKPRKSLISIESTPYYHCSSRCVRRAYLCGDDPYTGKNYDHRREWIENKLLELPKSFAIEVASYAVMHNHYHTVLFINTEKAAAWSDLDVIVRWHQIFKGTSISRKCIEGDEELSTSERIQLKKSVKLWRGRLQDISWFMRIINENLARISNKEDNCTGRFWEGRYSSQALLDDKALITGMVYVDLNPVRAKIAKTPETSDHTSIKRRCHQAKKAADINAINQQDSTLHPFVSNLQNDQLAGIQMSSIDYIELVDSTGRILRDGKRGTISSDAALILNRLGIEQDKWLKMTSSFETCFSSFVGDEQSLRAACESAHYLRSPGLSNCKSMFG